MNQRLVATNAAEFEQLQRKLVALWQQIGSGPGGPVQDDNTVVVVPSLSVDVDLPTNRLQAYEQRFLFLLFLLRQPRLRVLFITSRPVQPEVIDYYLHILPGIVFSNARKRLFLLSVQDGSAEPLSQKLLERPHIIARIRTLIPNPNRAHMIPYNTTDLERELALQLGIPMYAADPTFFGFGTKSGGRRIFAEEDVPYPIGYEDLFSEEALVEAICRMRTEKPALTKLIVKLNEGVGGMGNATVDLRPLPPGNPAEVAAVTRVVRAMQFELASVSYASYLEHVEKGGAIVEELIRGQVLFSPSAQLRITPLGELEMLSTHDQILGGPTGQSYVGARFPARTGYAGLIMHEAEKVGRRLAREGVIGRCAIDFVVVQGQDGEWQPYAIEINLRKGGTTAPFLILQYMTDGKYNAQTGVFRTAGGSEKYYVSSDHVESAAYRVFTPDSLFDLVSLHRLHYDHTSHTGVVLHMLGDVGGTGQMGVTAIANSHAEADALYDRFVSVLDQEVQACHEP